MEMSSLMITNIIFYALFAVAGLPANAFLIVASRRRRRSTLLPVGDLLVLNLALADFLHIVFRNLSVVVSHVASECLLGALPCSAIGAAMYFTIGLSANFTLMLSLYRLGKLRHVCRPSVLVARMEGSRWPPRVAAAAWLFCCASALPYVALLERTETAGDACVCTANPRLVRGGEHLLAYNIFQQVLYEFTPVVGMVLANAKIVAFLLTRRRRQVLTDSSAAGGARRLVRQVRAAKVLVLLALLFVLCWGTHVLVSMFFALDKVAVLAARVVGMLHSVCSPYLVVVGNRGLRSRLWAALGRGGGGGGGGGRVGGWWRRRWRSVAVEPSSRRSGDGCGSDGRGGGGGAGRSRVDVELPPVHADGLQSSISFSQQLRMASL